MILAQISDLHVRPAGELYYGVADSNAMLDAAIDHLNALQPRPDLVLVSGDLVDEGQDAEYAALRPRLDRSAIPYLVMPGNHDSRDGVARCFADHGYLPKAGPMHYAIEDYPVRIVAFDTTVPGRHHGAADQAGLDWLDRTLAADRTRPVLLAMHHHPFACGIPYLDRYRCDDGDALAAVVARHGHVERVVCGHVHRLMLRRWGGTVLAACPSTATQIALRLDPDAAPASFGEPPGLLLHHWRPDTGLTTHLSPIGRFAGPYDFF